MTFRAKTARSRTSSLRRRFSSTRIGLSSCWLGGGRLDGAPILRFDERNYYYFAAGRIRPRAFFPDVPFPPRPIQTLPGFVPEAHRFDEFAAGHDTPALSWTAVLELLVPGDESVFKGEDERYMAHTCVIFGGTGTIGRSIADLLLESRWRVVTVSRRSLDLTENVATHVVADVTSEESVATAVKSISDTVSINAMVYAIGLMPDVEVPLWQYPSKDWRRTFAAYLDGFFYVYKAVLPVMNHGGHIVAISSAITRLTSDTLPPFNVGHYAAAKAAMDEFCKWARKEAHGKGVLLSRLAPASVRSPASKILGVPPGKSLPVADVASRVVSAIINDCEIDEQMLVTPKSNGAL